MRHFCTIALLLGCISVVCFQTQSVQAASKPQTIPDPKLKEVMTYYFKGDHVQSPLRKVQGGGQDSSFQLTEAIAGYMRKADTAQLKKLFYEPDFNTWAALYKQVTKRECSTVDLITLLDDTKAKIFRAYEGHDVGNGNAYVHMTFLFDEAMKRIFEGCWGISNQSIEPTVINRLKQVYARAVAMELQGDDRLLNTLEGKAKAQPQQAAHYRALQECAAAVVYKKHRNSNVGRFIKERNLSLDKSSFQAVLGILPLPQIWQGQVSNHFMSFFRPGTFSQKQGSSQFKPFDPLAPLAPALNPLVQTILALDVEDISKARKVEEAIFQIIDNNPLKSIGSTDKISSLTPKEQKQLLDQFIKALNKEAYRTRSDAWYRFLTTPGFGTFFDQKIVAFKMIEGLFEDSEIAAEPVNLVRISHSLFYTFSSIRKYLPDTKDEKPLEENRDIQAFQEEMIALVEGLLDQKSPNRTPQQEKGVWETLLQRKQRHEVPFFFKTRGLLIKKLVQCLDEIYNKQVIDDFFKYDIEEIYKELNPWYQRTFREEVQQPEYFNAFPKQERDRIFKEFNECTMWR